MLRETNTAIAQALGGDPAVVNPSRIMRLPGSIAWPVKSRRVAELVELHIWPNRPPAYLEDEVIGAFPLDVSALDMSVKSVFGKSGPPDRWVEMLKNGAAEGERNTTATALFGYLLRHDIGPNEAWEIGCATNESRFKPPLESAELHTVLESIAERELKRRGR